MKQPQSVKSLEQIRISARRRLIGAIVLVVLAIAILPWVLKSKPREESREHPIQVIEEQVNDRATAVTPPTIETIQTPPSEPTQTGFDPIEGGTQTVVVDPSIQPDHVEIIPDNNTGREGVTSPTIESNTTTEGTKRPNNARTLSSKIKPGEKFAAVGAELSQEASDTTPEGATNESATSTKPSTPPVTADDESKKFIIQVGAYANAEKASEIRARLSLEGYTSYTQEVQSNAGTVTRVRVGPIAGRKRAEEIAERLKNMGLTPNVLPG